MERVSVTDLRRNLIDMLDRAVSEKAPILVTRPKGRGDVILLSAEEFALWEQTVDLLRNPANAKQLLTSIGCVPSAPAPAPVATPASTPAPLAVSEADKAKLRKPA